jgi:phospholipid/cholesterol/gamma-HCH transport system substrate-binding protein
VKNLSSQAKVGLLVLGGLLALVYMTIKVERFSITKEKGYLIKAVFDSAAGLDEKALVEVAGVEAGRVEKIRLVGGKAELSLRIKPDIELHKNAQASIRSIGLLGDKYVALTSGSSEYPMLTDGGIIETQVEMADFDKLAGRLSAIAEDIKAVTDSIKKVLGGEKGRLTLQRIIDNIDSLTSNVNMVVIDNQQSIKQALENINHLSYNLDLLVTTNKETFNTTMQNIAQLTESLNEIVVDNRSSLANTIAHLEKFSQILEQKSPDITNNMDRILSELNQVLQENKDNLRLSMVKIRDASEKLDNTVGSLEVMSQKIASGEGTIGKLIYEEDTYNNLNETLGGLREYFKGVEAWKFYLGVRSEYLSEEESSKTYVSLRLQPREDKYYLLEVVDDPRGKITNETTRRTIDGESTTIKEEMTKDQLKFSLQLAKRFYDLTIRGGMIESSGGVGLDYELFDNKLKLSLEGWDFGENEPHLKLTGNLYFYDRMFINTGMDDLLDEDYRSFFVGAGLLFSDQDMKYLLGNISIR